MSFQDIPLEVQMPLENLVLLEARGRLGCHRNGLSVMEHQALCGFFFFLASKRRAIKALLWWQEKYIFGITENYPF